MQEEITPFPMPILPCKSSKLVSKSYLKLGTLLKERVDILKSVVALFENMPAYIIGIALTVFCLILVFILLKISIAMINKKEY